MGLAWIAGWTPLGVLLGAIWNPAASADKLWVPVGAQPGFACGVLSYSLFTLTQGRRRLDELSFLHGAVGGMLVGLFVGALPFGIGVPTTDLPIELLAVQIIGPVALTSTASAVAAVLLARVRAARSPSTRVPRRPTRSSGLRR
jgi:hypothetical protein